MRRFRRDASRQPEFAMWSLVVGVAGFATVLTAAALIHRHNKKHPERWLPFARYDTVSYCSLTYLCFYIGPGVASLFGVIPDPVMNLARESLVVGAAGLVLVAVVAPFAIRRAPTESERSLLSRRVLLHGLLLLIFFVAPGALALFDIVPDPVPGVSMAVAIAVYFFIEMWWVRALEHAREGEKVSAGAP